MISVEMTRFQNYFPNIKSILEFAILQYIFFSDMLVITMHI